MFHVLQLLAEVGTGLSKKILPRKNKSKKYSDNEMILASKDDGICLIHNQTLKFNDLIS